jgi:hypothetical protein
VAYSKTLLQHFPEGKRVGDLTARINGTAVLRRSPRDAKAAFWGFGEGR